MTRARSEYDTAAYKEARRKLLKDEPLCHWCRKNVATEADHLVEHAAGGSIADGLVPACKPCNSSRGATYKNKTDAMRIQKRNKIVNGFLHRSETPPSPIQLFTKNGLNQPEPAATRHDRPRLETISQDGVGSWAAIVGDIASEYLGLTMLPWQMHVLDQMLTFNADQDLVHRSSLVSVARQNGKTTVIQALILFWLIEMPKIRGQRQTVVSLSHRLDLACMLFEEIAPILEKRCGAKVIMSYGRYQATMPDGSKWYVKAARPSVGHGMTIDLAIIDELFDVSDEVEAGLLPAQRARRSPLTAMFSTAGTEASTLFIRHRENALRLIDLKKPSSFYFAEWSPEPSLDPLHEASWYWGNPAIGHFLTIDTLRQESEGPDRALFLRGALNMWVASANSWIPHGLWPELLYEGEVPAGGVVAVEASMDDTRYFATRSVSLPDGRVVNSVAFTAETQKELLEHLAIIAKDPAVKFAFSPTIDVLVNSATFDRRRIVVGYGEILKYTPVVKNMIHEMRLVHTGEAMLSEHVQRAVLVRTQGSIAVSSQKSPGPIELCRTMIWSATLASQNRVTQKPSLVIVPN